MPIPDFQSLFLPLLKFCADGKQHTSQDARDSIAKDFGLTESELKEMLPSGKQTTFSNRLAWSKTYLLKAGLLEAPSRGVFRISPRGIKVLDEQPEKLNVKYLKQYPEFKSFHTATTIDTVPSVEDDISATPEETLEKAYQTIRSDLGSGLIQLIIDNSPKFFERIVVQLLVKMGYGGTVIDAGRVIGKSGDEGIDGIINEDRLGLDVIYIQAKRWQSTVVGRPEIQKFVGALHGKGAKKGVFIIASTFSAEARQFAKQLPSPKVVLIDGKELVDLMIDYNLGVSVVNTFEIKKIDTDFFIEE